MKVWNDPFFWAFLSMIGWSLGPLSIGTKKFGKNLSFGVISYLLWEIPRIIIVAPFVDQPRFGASTSLMVIGIIILALAFIFAAIPAFVVEPLTGVVAMKKLRTQGFYSIVRHPIMLGESLGPLGVALIFRSTIGLIMFVLWVILIYLGTFFEEEMLVEAYGDEYLAYQKKVPRIIPFIKFL